MKNLAYLASKVFFYAFSIFFIFVLVVTILAFTEYTFGWDVPFVEITNQNGEDFAVIKIPLIELSVGFVFNIAVAFVMWIGLLFYTSYFFALKEFLKVFVVHKSFIVRLLKRLQSFFYINLIPSGYAIVLSGLERVQTGGFKF